jgi:hypothetical protein
LGAASFEGTDGVNEDARMLTQAGNPILRGDLNVEETIESDNIVRWDGERLYVEQDVYHNGQLVHRKYRRTVTEPVARALLAVVNRAKQ